MLKTPEGERRLEVGDEVVLQAGTIHSLHNDGDAEAVCECEYRPALRSEKWLMIAHAVHNTTGKESLLHFGAFIGDAKVFIASVPHWIQVALFWVLKPLATLLGKKREALQIASRVYGRSIEWE